MRIKLFQGVLVNYNIARRDNYVNKMYTIPSVAALYFESWWAACLGLGTEGKDAKPMSQIRPSLDL